MKFFFLSFPTCHVTFQPAFNTNQPRCKTCQSLTPLHSTHLRLLPALACGVQPRTYARLRFCRSMFDKAKRMERLHLLRSKPSTVRWSHLTILSGRLAFPYPSAWFARPSPHSAQTLFTRFITLRCPRKDEKVRSPSWLSECLSSLDMSSLVRCGIKHE